MATLRETAGKYEVTLTNRGTTSLSLVAPGDGSEAGWRTPVITWNVTSNGAKVAPLPYGRCGMMNPIEEKDVFSLAPNASRDISEWIHLLPYAPGSYDLSVSYRNDPTMASRAHADASVTKKLAKTQRCEVTSNSIKVRIKAP